MFGVTANAKKSKKYIISVIMNLVPLILLYANRRGTITPLDRHILSWWGWGQPISSILLENRGAKHHFFIFSTDGMKVTTAQRPELFYKKKNEHLRYTLVRYSIMQFMKPFCFEYTHKSTLLQHSHRFCTLSRLYRVKLCS